MCMASTEVDTRTFGLYGGPDVGISPHEDTSHVESSPPHPISSIAALRRRVDQNDLLQWVTHRYERGVQNRNPYLFGSRAERTVLSHIIPLVQQIVGDLVSEPVGEALGSYAIQGRLGGTEDSALVRAFGDGIELRIQTTPGTEGHLIWYRQMLAQNIGYPQDTQQPLPLHDVILRIKDQGAVGSSFSLLHGHGNLDLSPRPFMWGLAGAIHALSSRQTDIYPQ